MVVFEVDGIVFCDNKCNYVLVGVLFVVIVVVIIGCDVYGELLVELVWVDWVVLVI